MLNSEDYKEPPCALCGGKEFYNPKQDEPIGRIPVARVLEKVDECFNRNDYTEAGRLLEYWTREAVSLKDTRGELSLQSELVGYYRKQNDKARALSAITRALTLVSALAQDDNPTGATVLLNCATAYKAFGQANDALPLFIQAEKIYLHTLENGDARLGGLYNNMALCLSDLGKDEQAENAYNKAISVMERVADGQADLAITYVNLAHLYEKQNAKDKRITDCLFTAYNLLNSENLARNGYLAFVLTKCAPSFQHFGFDKIYNDFIKEAKEIYEGN